MTQDTRPVALSGKCTDCGRESMTRAQDLTEYSPCEFVDGKWQTTYADLQDSSAEDAVRFFCADCGTQHQVPEELQ